MKYPKVSIIVPVYNVEKYLGACLGSILKQNYRNIEIVLVDDGSTDNSGTRCNEWAQKDERIKVIHKDNEGLNYARRDGFKISSGEYIMFLDSDDLLYEQAAEVSLREIIDNQADIVSYTFTKFSDKDDGITKQENRSLAPYETRILDNKEKMLRYVMLEDAIFPNSHAVTVWGKLYRRRVVDSVDWTLSNFRSYEDNLWAPQAFAAAQRAILLSCPLYFYRRNEQYGVRGSTLGNRLTGNTYNNQPIGYVEMVDVTYKYYEKLAKKYKINIGEHLREARFSNMCWRLRNLIEAELVDRENNLKYLKEVWVERDKRDAKQKEYIADLNLIVSECNAKLAGIYGSKSWKITKPLRVIMNRVKR